MDIQFWASTDVGRVRDHNEDNFLVDKRLRLFVVCDGMGGHAAGEVASAMCVKLVREELSQQRELIEYVHQTPDDLDARRQLLGVLEQSLSTASRRVYEAALEDESKRGMGTTCCVLLLTNQRAFIAHVGDSRIYLLRQGDVHQMTEDHSLYNEMVRMGKIRKGDPVNLPNKNAVTRAIGVREHVDVDAADFDLEAGDRFLICSDGLSGYFTSHEQIASMIGISDVRTATEHCIDFAVDAGGKDNITAILVNIVFPGVSRSVGETERAESSVLDALKQSPVFDYLSQKELGHIRGLIELKQFQAGMHIVEPREELSNLSLILFGEVEVCSPDGRILKTLYPGDHIGDLGFVDARESPVYLTAKESCKLVTLSRKQLMDLFRHESELSVKILWNLLQVFAGQLRQLPLEFMIGAGEMFNPASWEEDTKPPVNKPHVEIGVTSTHSVRVSPPTGRAMSDSQPVIQAPSATAAVADEMWGFEATQKGSLDEITESPSYASSMVESDDEDLRKTTEFSREDIEAFEPEPVIDGDLTPPPSNMVPSKPAPLQKPRRLDLTPPRAPRPVPPLSKGISGEGGTQQSAHQTTPKKEKTAAPRATRPLSGGIKGTSKSAESPFGGRKPVASSKPARPSTLAQKSNPFDRKPGTSSSPSVQISAELSQGASEQGKLPRDVLANTMQIDPDEFEQIKAAHKAALSQQNNPEEH